MTTADPRDRLALRRRHPLTAALRLEAAADAMRATVRPEAEPEHERAPITAGEFARLVDPDPAPGPVAPDPAPAFEPDYDPGPRAGEYGADYADDLVRDLAAECSRCGHPRSWHDERGACQDFDPCEVCSDLGIRAKPRLDWRPNHDERSRLYGVRSALAGAVPLQPVLLSTGPTLDQGGEGACFGYAGVDAVNVLDLIRRPGATDLRDGGDALELYRLAQRRDEIPGESYSGTSVTGGMKAGKELGLWGGYRWCFGTADIAQTLLRRQPVIIGIPWFAGMYTTGPRGVVTVSGERVGGHCLAIVGMMLTGPNGEPGIHFVWQNSWGPGYGDEGLGYVAHRTLATLLHTHGEAAVPMVTPQAPAVAA